ncbi:uncharacterized protein LOC134855523 [Symsagittifera roscoffensis]|uniref:uncharacterized protein LOC134855479 n=1 Tax=Symsagittifera roscoffensis TaxID=84072 RepID=UPI00307C4B41
MFAKIAVLTIVLFAVVYSQDSDNGHAEQLKMFDSFLTGLDLELDKKEEVLAGLLKEISSLEEEYSLSVDEFDRLEKQKSELTEEVEECKAYLEDIEAIERN